MGQPFQIRVAVYVILLCLANDSAQRGSIFLDDEDIAAEVEMCREDWLTLKAKFKARGLIDFTCNAVTLLLWDSEQNTQYKYPSDCPEAARKRAAKYRANKKAAKEVAKESAPVVTNLTRDDLVISANGTSVTKTVANAENTLYESVTADVTADKEAGKPSRIVTNFTRDDLVICADFLEKPKTVTSAENALYEVVTDYVTRDFVTSVTSDFEERHECVTSRHEESRGITSAGSPDIKPFQECVTSVTTQERDIDINIEIRNIELEGSTNVDLSVGTDLSEEVDCKPAIAGNAPPVTKPLDFEPLTLPLIFEPETGAKEPEVETGGVAQIENISQRTKNSPRTAVTLSEAVEILKSAYNEFKPQSWAACQMVSPQRQAKLKKVIATCGGLKAEGVEKARGLMEAALRDATLNSFWGQRQSGSKFDIDMLLRDDRVYSFSDRWLDSAGSDTGTDCPVNESDCPVNESETPYGRTVREKLERRLSPNALRRCR